MGRDRAHKWLVVKHVLLVSLCVLVAAGTATSSAAAREAGLATEGCTGCHNGGREAQVTITPSLPSVSPGQTIRLTIAIEAINGNKGGLYVTSTPGVGTFKVTDSQYTKLSSDGIVHSAAKTASGSEVKFSVDWTAPSQPGGVAFKAYVISANGDRKAGGDGAGFGFLSLAFGCAGTKYFGDNDGDGNGSTLGEYRIACTKPMFFSESSDDCDDNDERVRVGAVELCNGRDDNCNSMVDEGLVISTYCEDKDGDGHGVQSANTKMGCGISAGFGLCDNDCNDTSSSIYPSAQELCNFKDDDCNGRIDDNAKQACGIGWCRRLSECNATSCTPGKPRAEECNFLDDDCDGVIDNGSNLCAAGQSCIDGSCVVGRAPDAGVGQIDGGARSDASMGTGSSGSGPVSDDGLGASDGGCRAAPSGAGGGWALLLLVVYRRRARSALRSANEQR